MTVEDAKIRLWAISIIATIAGVFFSIAAFNEAVLYFSGLSVFAMGSYIIATIANTARIVLLVKKDSEKNGTAKQERLPQI